jgi:hypothetical protein
MLNGIIKTVLWKNTAAIYSSFTVLIRRSGSSNNFKAVESDRDMLRMQERLLFLIGSRCFLGYGNRVTSMLWTHFPCPRLISRTHFLDLGHLQSTLGKPASKTDVKQSPFVCSLMM